MKIAVVPELLSAPGNLAQCLAHQPGLQADVAVPHLTFDLRPAAPARPPSR